MLQVPKTKLGQNPRTRDAGSRSSIYKYTVFIEPKDSLSGSQNVVPGAHLEQTHLCKVHFSIVMSSTPNSLK